MDTSIRTLASRLAIASLFAGAVSAQSADPSAGITQRPQDGLLLNSSHPDDPMNGVTTTDVTPAGGTVTTYSAGTNAIDFTLGSGTCGVNQGQTVGWQFDLAAPTTVCAMTWFDDNQDGLEIGHEVGIWDPSGTLIASTNVMIPAGAGAALDGVWRRVAIAPTVLPAGAGYIVGGYNGAHSECLNANVTQMPNAAISYVDATFSGLGVALDRPVNFSSAINGFYGVSFQIEAGAPSKANAVDFNAGSGTCGANSDQTIGWQFDVLTPVTVTSMTWFDDGQNGLDISHEVAIWSPGGVLIPATNVVVPAGVAAPLDGIWRTVSIPATILPPGAGYIVGGYNGAAGGECLSSNVTQMVHPNLNYVDATFSAFGPVLDRPANFSSAINGFYGVGFQVSDGGPSAYCDPGNANSVSAGGAVLASTGGYGTAGATFLITDTPDQPGILFAGPNQLNLPFGCGQRCVGGQVVRGAVVFPVGNMANASFDMTVAPNLDFVQWWYRDPVNLPNCGNSFNLSNALMP